MGLNADSCSSSAATLLPGLGHVDFAKVFANFYDNYAKQGVVIGAVNSGGNKAALEGALRSVSASTASIDIMALGFASYWSQVALVGNGAHGGAPISVVNDAMAKVSVFRAAIVTSITQIESKPYYEVFITNIESAVKSLIWAVIEAMPPHSIPTTFAEPII